TNGSATTVARSDHRHGREAFGTPGSSAVGDAAANGSATTVARSDHQHGREAFGTPGSSALGDAPAQGSAPTVARSDHVHGRESAAVGGDLSGSLPNPSVAQASGAFALTGVVTPAQITADEDDYDPPGLAAASVLLLSTDATHNLTGFAHGTSVGGRLLVVSNVGAHEIVLKANTGSAAGNRLLLAQDMTLASNESALFQYDSSAGGWRLAAGAGVTFGTPGSSAVGDGAAAGSASTAARSDHVHGRESFGTPGSSAVGDAAAAGTALTVAHSDHVHGREGFATPGSSAVGDSTSRSPSGRRCASPCSGATTRTAASHQLRPI